MYLVKIVIIICAVIRGCGPATSLLLETENCNPAIMLLLGGGVGGGEEI